MLGTGRQSTVQAGVSQRQQARLSIWVPQTHTVIEGSRLSLKPHLLYIPRLVSWPPCGTESSIISAFRYYCNLHHLIASDTSGHQWAHTIIYLMVLFKIHPCFSPKQTVATVWVFLIMKYHIDLKVLIGWSCQSAMVIMAALLPLPLGQTSIKFTFL